MDGTEFVTARPAIFLGSKAFGLSIFKALTTASSALSWMAIHPDDRRDARSVAGEFERYCAGRSIPFEIVGGPAHANERLLTVRPEFVFVCGWYWLVPPQVLNGGPKFFGIHNSLLPSYRGGAPLVWALIQGERTVGSTLFEFRPGMDDGPVYLQVSVEVAESDGIGDVLTAVEEAFAEALPETWRGIVGGAVHGIEQDHGRATYCAQRIEADGRIDWTCPARQIHDFVRAQTHPYPGAFTSGPAGTIRIWKTRPLAEAYLGTPGQVISRRATEVLIACGQGTALEILEASDASGQTVLPKVFPSLEVRLGRFFANEDARA